jgi:membrane protease YdiL (CAAX protease family)
MAITVVPPISLTNDRLPPLLPTKLEIPKKISKVAAKKPLGKAPAPVILTAPELPIENIDEQVIEAAVVKTQSVAEAPESDKPSAPKLPKPPRRQRIASAITRIRAPFIRFNNAVKAIAFNTWLISIYMLLIGVTQLTLIGYPIAGLYVNVLMLVVMIIVALWRVDARKLSISLAILPVTQMLSSTIPAGNAFRAACIFYGTILLLSLIYRYLFTLDEPVEATALKTRGHAFGIPLMLVLGEVVGCIGYGFMRHHYPYMHISLPLVASASVIFAFAEEMFLRGLVQQQASQLVHPVIAGALTSVMFVFLAVGNITPLTIAPAVALGVVLSAVYHYKRNLLLSTTINAAAKLTYVGLVATFILR